MGFKKKKKEKQKQNKKLVSFFITCFDEGSVKTLG